MGINGKWPLPTIEVDKGDRVIVNLYNGLGDQNTSLHFHGLFQNGTNAMDGPAGVTQCPVAPGQSIIYDFVVSISPPPIAVTLHDVDAPFFNAIGRSARNILVPCSRERPISRWTPWGVDSS